MIKLSITISFALFTSLLFAEAPSCGNQWGGTAEPMGCLRSVEPAGSKSVVKNNTTSTTSNFVYDVTLSNFDSRTKGASVFVVDTTANQTYRPLYDASDWNTDTLKTQAENLCESLIKNGCSSSSTGITGVTGYSPSTYTFATASSPSQAQAKFENVSVNQSNKSFILGCYDVCDCGVGPGVTQESPDKKPYVLAERLSLPSQQLIKCNLPTVGETCAAGCGSSFTASCYPYPDGCWLVDTYVEGKVNGVVQWPLNPPSPSGPCGMKINSGDFIELEVHLGSGNGYPGHPIFLRWENRTDVGWDPCPCAGNTSTSCSFSVPQGKKPYCGAAFGWSTQ